MAALESVAKVQQDCTMIGLLDWAIRRQRADLVIECHQAVSPADFYGGQSGCGCMEVARNARLGVRVDSSSGYGLGLRLPVDAQKVYHLMRARLELTTFALVRDCARAGRSPDTLMDTPVVSWGPELVGEGRVRTRRVAANGAVYCPIVLQDHAREISYRRWLYTAWWDGVALLTEVLRGDPGHLEQWRVVSIGAPRTPWHAEKKFAERLDLATRS